MLSAAALKRVEKNWNPEQWPEGPAADYAKAMHRRPFTYFRDRVAHLGLSGDLVVDAGCGTGTWSFALACTFKRVAAFDFTQERVSIAQWLKKKFAVQQPEFSQGDIRSLPIDDNSADAVFCYSVLLGAVPLDQAFGEFRRILRPGGVAYVELNGIGYSYNLFRGEGPNRKVGAGSIYNTLGLTALQPVIALVRPGGPRNAVVLAGAESKSPLDILRAADAGGEAMAAAEAIVNDLGDEYRQILFDDLTSIGRGEREQFSQPSRGRGYSPQELQAVSAGLGFRRYEWAHEGMLSLQSDGLVRKEASPAAPPISKPDFEGHLRRFESLIWK